jgi:hypothetical protein
LRFRAENAVHAAVVVLEDLEGAMAETEGEGAKVASKVALAAVASEDAKAGSRIVRAGVDSVAVQGGSEVIATADMALVDRAAIGTKGDTAAMAPAVLGHLGAVSEPGQERPAEVVVAASDLGHQWALADVCKSR